MAKHICKNCKLFDATNGLCRVKIIHQGEHIQLPVFPDDKCHWEEMGIEVSQMRAWSDGKDGYIEFS